MELQAVPEFDYVVVNDDLEKCLEELRSIVQGGRVVASAPEVDVDGLRLEIRRLLDDEYAEYVNITD
jgi:hypothetical protein